MVGHGTKFGRKKEEAIAALLSQRNLEEAARTIGVVPNTLLRWMKVPEFQAAYREARRTAFGQSIARLQQAATAAVTLLLKIIADPTAPASTRVRAAASVLDHAAKAIELEARLLGDLDDSTRVAIGLQVTNTAPHLDLSKLNGDELQQLRALVLKAQPGAPAIQITEGK